MKTPLRGRITGWLVLLLLVPWAAQAAKPTDVPSYLRSINHLYENLEYERALHQIELARKVSRGAEDEVTLGLYEGIILCEQGQWPRADKAFEGALLLQPDAVLPVEVAPKIQKRFEAVRERLNPSPVPPPVVAKPEPPKAPAASPGPDAVAKAPPRDAPRASDLTPPPISPVVPRVPEERAVASTPLTQRWYFWAGVGTVAVAAVTTAVVVSSSRVPSPTDICGGACDGTVNAPAAVRF